METFESTAVGFDFADQFLNLNAGSTQVAAADYQHPESTQLYGESSDFVSSPVQQPSTTDLGFLLNLPEEGAGLEWISQFLEDSFSQFYYPITETASPPAYTSSSLTESTTSSSPSSSATSSMCCPTSPSTPLAFHDRKQRKKKKGRAGGGPLRCSHCGIEKTPQWRAGPMGAKTLCNACGVRFKSGRLLPEYRPACSPTFSTRLHSNSHRKIMEMRRKKEMVGQTETGFFG